MTKRRKARAKDTPKPDKRALHAAERERRAHEVSARVRERLARFYGGQEEAD